MALIPLVTIDSATWSALALALTVLGAILTVVAWRRRGPAAGIRGAAWTLVPIAAWLTGTLRLAVSIAEDVVSWAARLVFSPVVWLGVAAAGVAALLFVVSGAMRTRGIGIRRGGVPTKEVPTASRGEVGPSRGQSRGQSRGKSREAPPARRREDPVDDDMAEIEAILKRRGI